MEKHKKILRVAAYCRVSTNEKEQQNSYENQIAYYTDYIASNESWYLVGIFADKGLSGTMTKNRTSFNKMIRMCKKGLIDLILCKSISRFARNTVDCLNYVRELKSLGISVYFEKENINTGNINSEFMITLYAAFAQAESESISKNITWGIENRFKKGKYYYNFTHVLGYRLGPDKTPIIIENEAKHVREIFTLFIEGKSMGEIAKIMTAKGVVRRNGSSVWIRKNVEQVLKNEKYCGRIIMQKTVTIDCISHERQKNDGIKPKYVIENAHEKIIDSETFDKARLMMVKRRIDYDDDCKARKRTIPRHPLFRLVYCPYCGSVYRRVTRVYKGRKFAVWRCGGRLEGGKERCSTSPTIDEEVLQDLVLNYLRDYVNAHKPALLSLASTPVFKPSADLAEATCEYVLSELAENGVGSLNEIPLEKIVRRITVVGKDAVRVEMVNHQPTYICFETPRG